MCVKGEANSLLRNQLTAFCLEQPNIYKEETKRMRILCLLQIVMRVKVKLTKLTSTSKQKFCSVWTENTVQNSK
jgi:hypothetical protein